MLQNKYRLPCIFAIGIDAIPAIAVASKTRIYTLGKK